MLRAVANALNGLTSDRIIIRTLPADSPRAISVVATTIDPVAAALGLGLGLTTMSSTCGSSSLEKVLRDTTQLVRSRPNLW
jgi:hypothetical protein